MTLQEFLLFFTAILLSSAGQALLKLGAIKLGKVNSSNFFSHLLNILVTPELLAGLFLYGFSAMLFILILTRVKLSVAGPAVSLGYIFSVMIGYFMFKETISTTHMIGLALIICGVILVVQR